MKLVKEFNKSQIQHSYWGGSLFIFLLLICDYFSSKFLLTPLPYFLYSLLIYLLFLSQSCSSRISRLFKYHFDMIKELHKCIIFYTITRSCIIYYMIVYEKNYTKHFFHRVVLFNDVDTTYTIIYHLLYNHISFPIRSHIMNV